MGKSCIRRKSGDYLIEVGKKAGEAGFDEIQFDYIRLPWTGP